MATPFEIKVTRTKDSRYRARIINRFTNEYLTEDESHAIEGVSNSRDEAIRGVKTKAFAWMQRWGVNFISQYRELKQDLEAALSAPDSVIMPE